MGCVKKDIVFEKKSAPKSCDDLLWEPLIGQTGNSNNLILINIKWAETCVWVWYFILLAYVTQKSMLNYFSQVWLFGSSLSISCHILEIHGILFFIDRCTCARSKTVIFLPEQIRFTAIWQHLVIRNLSKRSKARAPFRINTFHIWLLY